MSTGTTSLMKDVISLGVAASMLALAVAHLDSIRAFTRASFGAPEAQNAAAADNASGETSASSSDGTVELRAGDNGHYHADAEINGRSVEVLVDTGASMVALTYRDAEQAGIFLKPSDFTERVNTANGVARVAPVHLDRVSIGDITVRNVTGVVAEEGRLQTSLLGMSFLGRLDRVDMRSGTLILED